MLSHVLGELADMQMHMALCIEVQTNTCGYVDPIILYL